MIRSARREVTRKSDHAIESETAYKWAGRALACYEQAARATGETAAKWLLRAEEYRHEALEHAALVQDFGKTVGMIERELDRKTGRRMGRRRRA